MRRSLALACSLVFCLAVSLTFISAGDPTGADDTCVLFGVQDTGQADSSLFRVNILDPETGAVILELTDLVDCPDCDWEAIALDPTDGALYTVAGGNGSEDGKLWQVDKETGALTLIGDTGTGGADEIVSASFRRSDGVLWAFQEHVGLLTIDPTNALAIVEFLVAAQVDQFGNPLGDNWEGLGWDLDGSLLYGSDGTTLYVWDPDIPAAQLICDNLAVGDTDVEALEFMFNGDLIGGVNEASDATRMILIEFPEDSADWGGAACTITPLGATLVPSEDRDIESFVFEPCPYCGDGELDPGEECDEGINNSDEPGSTCRTDCTVPICGDGILDPGEECDEGDDNSDEPGSTCRTDCTLPFCGDGILDPGEECDEGDDNSDEPGSTCRIDCTLPFCGDGILDPGEECEPPGTDGCDANCMVAELGCRFTGGGVDTDGNWNHELDDGEMVRNGAGNLPAGLDRYQFGGQAGAHTALPDTPAGEWTHKQQRGPSGHFVFHGGSASAPDGTRIVEIRCSDPDNCSPARPAPAKQLDFDGIGTFKNLGRGNRAPTFEIAAPNVTAEGHGNQTFDGTFHWFEVNIDDLGEPGGFNSGAPDPVECPSIGFGEKGATPLANCDCPDFYRITIYDGVDRETLDTTGPNRTTVIYEAYGYVDGGNLQIHPLTGFDGNSNKAKASKR